jgi:ATP adenylyltransferase
MEYMKEDRPKDPGCLFCRVRAEDNDDVNLVVARAANAFLMLNAFPYTSGHLMAAPNRHTADFASLSPHEIADLTDLVRRAMKALDAVYHPRGYNVGMNLGEAAGAGIADHLHVHVVPRWVGDTNFMGAVGDTRVLPDSLEETARKIREALEVGLRDGETGPS